MKQTPDNQLTAEQSLDIITSMIQHAKGNVQKHSFHFLLWGWVVVLANLGMFVLTTLEFQHPYVVWAITIPAWIISFYVGFKNQKTTRAFTHYDMIQVCLWMSFGICVFTIVAFGFRINFQINPLILIISSIPTFLSGVLMRFRPLKIGGILFWAFGIVAFLVPVYYQPLVGATAVALGYLVPGYILKLKK